MYRIGFCGAEVAVTIIDGLISSSRQPIVFLQTGAPLLFHRSLLRLNTFECGIKLIYNSEGSTVISWKQFDIQQESISTISRLLVVNKRGFSITTENYVTIMSRKIFAFMTRRCLALCSFHDEILPRKIMVMVIMLLSAFLEILPVWSFQCLGSESKRDPCLQLIMGMDLDINDD